MDEKEALRIADEESGKGQPQETAISKMLPPIISISSPLNLDGFSDTEITVRYKIRNPSGEPVTEVKAFVDGRAERGIVKKGEIGEIHVKVPQQDCEISLIASNRYTSSEPATIKLLWRGKKTFAMKPKLYLLAIGISQYDKAELCLNFAAKDAKDIADILKRQEGGIYREVSVKILTDKNAARDNVMSGLEWIEKETTSKDVAVIFLAGHGVNDRNGDYYFLPANADPDQLKRTGIPYYEVKNTLIGLPGKSICFLDTCHAGNIMGDRRAIHKVDIDRIVNDLASAENGVVVFAASTGRQYSAENAKWENGAFTKALIEGLSGRADYTDDGQITINELDLYLSEEVKKLTGGRQTPTTTKPKTIQDFPIAIR